MNRDINLGSHSEINLKQEIRDIIQDAYSEAWNHDHISTERTDEFVSWVLELIQPKDGDKQ